MPTLGATELLIVLVIVLVLFGSARLPRLARSLGESVRELRGVSSAADEETSTPK